MSSKLGQNGGQKTNHFANADPFEELLISEVVCYDRILEGFFELAVV